MATFRHSGSFNKIEKFLNTMIRADYRNILARYGEQGALALSDATPLDTGNTASAWNFVIEKQGSTINITWTNDNSNDGVSVAILLQYGHGTGSGGYVSGLDYINPVMKPIFDNIAKEAWKEVSTA